jgi:lysophospholipase L1-like esterase
VCTGTPAKAITIYMIGDSTMSVYDASLYPRMGWGQPLGDLFASKCATVVDKALSGRSSKSFFDEGAWTPVKNALKSGDYVLIQFAHNDEKTDDATRYTDPQTTYKQYLTTYVTDARAKSATPLLLTPINRNGWSGTTVTNSHGAYPAAMRELAASLAASLSVELVDLTALTKTYFERIGQAETTKLFMDLAPGQFPNYPSGNTDNTHLQEVGARRIGQLAMADAYAQKLTIASFLAAVPTAP